MIILSKSQLLLLHSQLIAETDIAKRLRLIFSCTCSEGEELPETARVICTRLGCLTLCGSVKNLSQISLQTLV